MESRPHEKGLLLYSIGQFATVTGLTVKALRHYDALGLLHPADVDPHSGYRRYNATQAREAATISILRSMGVPLPAVEECLAQPDRVPTLLEEFARERDERRRREDALLAEGSRILAWYDEPGEVTRRRAPAQPWIGFRTRLPFDADDEAADQGTEEFEAFTRAAIEAGLEPAGPWWLTFEESDREGVVTARWCIPVRALPDSPVPGPWDVVQGTLPERTELVVSLDREDPSISPDLAAPHPGVLDLLDAEGGEGAEDIRQVYVTTPDGVRIDLVADVPAPSSVTPPAPTGG